MLILGINEGANASVVVCKDGKVVFGLQEERIGGEKEYSGFPGQALAFTLKHLKINPKKVDAVAFSNLISPSMSRAESLRAHRAHAEGFLEALCSGHLADAALQLWHQFPEHWRVRLRRPHDGGINKIMDAKLLEHGFDGVPVIRRHHHLNHAAAAYFGMRHDPLTTHLVLTLDGGGDDACSHVYLAEAGRMVKIASTPLGHSVGELYSAVTHMLGMTPREHEHKLMSLAPFAEWRALNRPLKAFNSYLDLDPENPLRFKRLVAEETGYLEPRLTRDLRRVRFDAVAGAIQLFTEDLLVRWVLSCVRKTGVRNVVAAGGVFMNVRANKLISELKELDSFDVFPSCGDESLAFGAAWQAAIELDRDLEPRIGFDNLYLGPEASLDLKAAQAEFADRLDFETLEHPDAHIAELLTEGKVVARCSGPMEFGARALGNRSVLADAGDPKAVARLRQVIGQRDFWVPLPPAALVERVDEYVQVPRPLPRPRVSPYMMHSFKSTDARDAFAAGVNAADGTTCLQVVGEAINPHFHAILSHFAEKTGRAVVINAALCLPGSPMVLGARDAMQTMLRLGLEYLVIDHVLVTPKKPVPTGRAARKASTNPPGLEKAD